MAGLLADLYSAIDSKKRQLRGLLDDPVETLRQGLLNFRDDQNKVIADAGVGFQLPGYQSVLLSDEQIKAARNRAIDAYTNQAMAAMSAHAKFVYPQDKALKTAQRNAEKMLGLPANNTPAMRAKAMGLDTDFFHGQRQPNPKREYIEGLGNVVVDQPELQTISKIKVGGGNGEGGAFFGTNDPFVANGYAGNGAVYPVQTSGKLLRESGVTTGNIEAFNRGLDRNKSRYFNNEIKQSIAEGKGGTVFRNVEDSAGQKLYDIPSDVYAITSAPVRSRFAAFDPARINENDLLAGAMPLGLLADEETRKKLGF